MNSQRETAGQNKTEIGRYMTAAEIMALKRPDVMHAIEGLLPVGASLLVGCPKAGKSYLALQMGVAVATGTPFLGHDVAQGDVLYLDLDDGAEFEASVRLRELMGRKPPPDGMRFRTDCPPGGFEDVVRGWKDALAKKPRLVIVDLLENVRPESKDTPGRAYSEDYAPARAFNRFARAEGLALLLVHHSNKIDLKGLNNPLNAISGTNGLAGGVSGNMVLGATPFDVFGNLYIAPRGSKALTLPLAREPSGPWRLARADERKAMKLSPAEQKIVDALNVAAPDPLRVAEIVERSGIKKETVERALKKLFVKKAVTRPGRGLWGR